MRLFSSKLSFAAITSLVLLGGPHSSAHADTLPSLESSCMTFSMQNEHLGDEHSTAEEFTSSLTGLNVGLNAHKVSIHSAEKLDENQFNALNGLASYFVMTGYHMELSPKCSGLPYKELSSMSAVQRDIRWEDVTLSRPGLNVTAKSFKISFAPQQGKIIMSLKVEDIKASKKTVLPHNISGTLELTPSNKAPYNLVIKSLDGDVAGSKFAGHGDISAGEELKSSKAHLHISIEHIAPVIREANVALSAKTNTALLIARFMAQHEANGALGWDAGLENSEVSINGIKMPMAFIGMQ